MRRVEKIASAERDFASSLLADSAARDAYDQLFLVLGVPRFEFVHFQTGESAMGSAARAKGNS